MAIGWLAIIKSVPWTDVISNASKLADGAKRLWSTVEKRRETKAPAAAQPNLSPEAQAIAGLEARLASMETAAADLHSQMLASSELIKELAEQNAQLIARIEASRVRLMWLAAIAAVATIVSVASLALTLAGRGV